jgi:hypothetical protein
VPTALIPSSALVFHIFDLYYCKVNIKSPFGLILYSDVRRSVRIKFYNSHILCLLTSDLVEHFRSHFTAVPLIFYLAAATVRYLSMSETHFSIPYCQSPVPCYHPPCHNCFHVAVIFISVAVKIVLRLCSS